MSNLSSTKRSNLINFQTIDTGQNATNADLSNDQQQDIAEQQAWNNKTIQKTSNQKRMSISLSGDVIEMLTQLAENQGITQNDAIKKAIATEWYFRSQMKQGAKVLIQTPENNIREVVLL